MSIKKLKPGHYALIGISLDVISFGINQSRGAVEAGPGSSLFADILADIGLLFILFAIVFKIVKTVQNHKTHKTED
jgi:hypothetical protein